MKKALFVITLMAINMIVIAETTDTNHDRYCAKMKDGKLVVMHQGSEMTSTATLSNGAKIYVDGTVIKADGSRITLKAGECVNMEGIKVSDLKKDKSGKAADEKNNKNEKLNDDMDKDKNKDKSTDPSRNQPY